MGKPPYGVPDCDEGCAVIVEKMQSVCILQNNTNCLEPLAGKRFMGYI